MLARNRNCGVRILFGNARLKFLENVEFGEIGLGFVQIVEILSAPAESLAFGALDAAGIDAAVFQHGFVFGGEVFAHDGDHANIGEVTCGQRKIGGSASENVCHLTGRRLDGVKGNGTNYQDAHKSP